MEFALQVTVLILHKDPTGLLDLCMCEVIFLCLLVLKEGGLCFSNNGICEDYDSRLF